MNYGGPAVLADAGAITLAGLSVSAESAPLMVLGLAGYALGAPINHLAHGHPGRALASFGLRTLAAGAATGVVLADVLNHPCDGEPSCRHNIGASVALATALVLTGMIVDHAWLARERVPAPPPRATLTPGLALGPGLAAVSLGGTF